MSLTLLVENNPKIESFYMLNLSTWLGLETITKKKTEFAIKYLETESDKVNLIIVRSFMDYVEMARPLIEFVQKKGLKIPIVVIGPGSEIPGSFAHVPNSLHLKELIQAAARALKITAKEMNSKVVPDFFPIPITYFKVLKRSVCPVYAQDIDDPTRYNMRIESMKDFDESFIVDMIQEGVDFLFVDKMDRLDFVNNVTSELMSTLEIEEVSEDEAINATDKGIELLSRKLLTIGVTEETITASRKNLLTLRKNVKSYPKLAKLLEKLVTNKASYLFKHTQVLIYVALHVIKHIDWGNAEQEEKMSFIAFFHDIVLEKDEHAIIKSASQLKNSKLTPSERQLVERHAQLSAELVTKFPHAPMGADQIIRQHHGTLNGVGFSEHYGNNVSPIAVVFIVAEEFTRIIMQTSEGPFNREDMIRELKVEFPTSRFQKVISLLETITF